MKKEYWIRLLILALILCVAVCSSCTPKFNPDNPPWNVCSSAEGEHPCDFTLMDQHGNQVRLYDFHGKVIILDFSTMWCGPCRLAAMQVDATTAKYEEGEVVYISVLIENSFGKAPDLRDLENWANSYGININPVLAGSRDWLETSSWHIQAWPTFFIIDQKMTLRSTIVGFSGASIEAAVEDLLLEQDTGSQAAE